MKIDAVWSAKLYSLGLNAAIALFAAASVGKGLDVRIVSTVILASWLMWLFFNWCSDLVQRERQKPRVSPMVLALLVVATAMLRPAPWPLFLLAMYVASIYLYGFKSRVSVLGPIGPVFRAATVVIECLWLASIASAPSFPFASITGGLLFVAVLNARRNYIGDIRDCETDRCELPARISPGLSILVSTIFSLILVGIVAVFLPTQMVLLVVCVEVASQGLLWSHLSKPAFGAFACHRSLIIADSALIAVLAMEYGASAAAVIFCVAAAVVLNWTYVLVPGKKYPRLFKTASRAAPPIPSPHDLHSLKHR